MSKFRKKPVVIEARQFTGETDAELELWLGDWFISWKPSARELIIRTLESNEHVASADDWIICGVKGEFYPCKPDIFEMTYEAVEDQVD